MGWQIRHQVMSVDDRLNSALNIEVQQHRWYNWMYLQSPGCVAVFYFSFFFPLTPTQTFGNIDRGGGYFKWFAHNTSSATL